MTVALRGPQGLYEDWERAHWAAQDVDLSRDPADWAAMAEDERSLLYWVLSSLMVAEERISTQFCGLVLAQDSEEEGSFLVGALSGLLTKTNKVGFVGGMEIPLIRKFQAGFVAGVKAVNPNAQVIVKYAGATSAAFKDPTKGKELALAEYHAGADIIFHASGSTGLGVFEAALELGKLAIGVDSDQHDEAPGAILTSMVKRVDTAVFDTIRDLKAGQWSGGVHEFGTIREALDAVSQRLEPLAA